MAVGRREVGEAAVVQFRLARDLGLAAIAALSAALGADGAGECGELIRPDHDIAAVAGGRRIGADRRRVVDGNGIGLLQRPLAMASATDVDGAATQLAGDIDGGARQRDVLAGDRDGSACGLAPGGTQPSRHVDTAASAAADEDGTGLATDAARLDQTRDVDRVARRFARGSDANDDAAAVSLDGARIADQRTIAAGCGRQRHLQEAVAGEIQRRAFTGTEPDLAERHDNAAGVGHRAAEQRGVAAAADRDEAGIADGRRGAIASEGALAALEIRIRNPERRGNEAADGVDHARSGDRDAVRVDEIDLAVGGQRTGDARRGVAGDAIEHCRSAVRLLDVHRGTLADRETLPVDDGALARLGNVQLRRHRRRHRHAARRHAAADRQVLRLRRTDQKGTRERAGGKQQRPARATAPQNAGCAILGESRPSLHQIMSDASSDARQLLMPDRVAKFPPPVRPPQIFDNVMEPLSTSPTDWNDTLLAGRS